MISYEPLVQTLRKRNLKKTNLLDAGISNVTLAKLFKNEYVSLAVIEKICIFLNCQIYDVIIIVPDKPAAKHNAASNSDTKVQ